MNNYIFNVSTIIRGSLIVLFLMLNNGTSYAKDPVLEKRHMPSGINSTFNLSNVSYDNYIQRSRDMIAAARVDLNKSNRKDIINANSPFELKPSKTCPAGKTKKYRKGILLTHGLTDSPYFLRTLGSFFQENCFRVMAILLPGHGTRPGDLLEVKWQDWAKAEAFGVDALAKEVDQIFLLGFSTGGALSVYQSLRDKRIKGLFLFSPAIKISPTGMLANWHEVYSWALEKGKWLDILPDSDPYKYESFTKNAADQIHLLTGQLNAELQKKRVNIPVFVALSEDDASVISSATFEFFAQAKHPINTALIYSTNKSFVLKGAPKDKVTVVNSVLPDQHIISSAHTAIVLPPTDPHYGVNGRYANCLHYYTEDVKKYKLCTNRKEDYLGELTDDNMKKKGVLRRLMYNSKFNEVKTGLTNFINLLPD